MYLTLSFLYIREGTKKLWKENKDHLPFNRQAEHRKLLHWTFSPRANRGAIIDFAYNHFDLLTFSFLFLQQLAENFVITWLCALVEGRKLFSII